MDRINTDVTNTDTTNTDVTEADEQPGQRTGEHADGHIDEHAAEQAKLWDLHAADYDDDDPAAYFADDPTACVDLIAALAAEGPALELGAGSGRIAVPLAQRGVPVTGVELSPQMAKVLQRRSAGLPVTVHVADMADLAGIADTSGAAMPPVRGPFRVAYAAWSSLYFLLTQDRQRRCIQQAAALLSPGGHLAVEGFLPQAGSAVGDRQSIVVRNLTADRLDVSATTHDPATQRIDFQEVRITDGRIRLSPFRARYIWPSELDLMAQIAGLTLTARYGDWDRRPYTGRSLRYVSVYGKPSATRP